MPGPSLKGTPYGFLPIAIIEVGPQGRCAPIRLHSQTSWFKGVVSENVGAAAPEVIAGQVDVLSAERRQVLQQRIIDGMAVATQRMRCPLQVDRVPQHDSSRYQVEAAGPVALLLKAAVADFAQPIEEYGAGQRVAGLALVQPSVDAATQLHALQPVQNEQRALDVPQLAQSHGQTRFGAGNCRACATSAKLSPWPA